jgi:RNA polymerase sigma-70 factor (ECF subfamily)
MFGGPSSKPAPRTRRRPQPDVTRFFSAPTPSPRGASVVPDDPSLSASVADGPEGRAPPIAAWLASARAGDALARDRLFAACRSFVTTAARCHLQRRLQAKVDASDVVQQSLLEAHRGLDGFAGETPQELLGWLRRIVAHNALDVARRYRGAAKRDAGREVPLAAHGDASGGWHAPPVDPASSPSARVMRGERELLLAAALEGLAEDQREVLVLRNIERLPFEEVARRMDRSSGACRMLWVRAIAALRERLPADLDDDEAAP